VGAIISRSKESAFNTTNGYTACAAISLRARALMISGQEIVFGKRIEGNHTEDFLAKPPFFAGSTLGRFLV
jgi:hypothetical protein